MTRGAFVKKWLANTEKYYIDLHINEMYDDLDKVIEYANKNETFKLENN